MDLYSTGGSPGVGNSTNAAAGFIAVLGDCANFAKLPTRGMANAALNAACLVDLGTGEALGTTPTGNG